MIRTGKDSALAWHRDGLDSFVLLHAADGHAAPFTVTWVDAAPGSAQPLHRHAHAQAYVVAAGEGRMLVDGEAADVKPGDIVFMPPGAEHSLANTGEGVLSYMTVAHPPFEIYRDRESGALRARS